jgi:hypothetical protein
MEFFAADIEKICGVKRNRLQTWLEKSWIIPSLQKASGRGTRNIFNEVDIACIFIFKACVESGLSREVVGQFIKCAYEELTKNLTVFRPKKGLKADNICPWHVLFARKKGVVIYANWFWFPDEIHNNEEAMDAWFEADDIIIVNITKYIDLTINLINQLD